MSFSFDINSNVGKVRNLIGDTIQSSAIFSDEEIAGMLSLKSNDVFLAAALCLRRMAANKAFLEKSEKAGDYALDTRGAAKALLDIAKEYENVANNEPADAQVEIIYNNFNFNDILRNRALRGENLD